MNITSVLMLGIFASIIGVVLREFGNHFSLVTVLGGGLVLFLLSLEQTKEIVDFVLNLQNKINLPNNYLKIILKVIGICVLSEFAISVAQDHHQNTLVTGLNLFSKTTIIVLSLPIFTEVIKIIGELVR